MPRLSIIIPVYNGAALLAEAVESVISQSFDDWELIIVDDGSTDGSTPAFCDSLGASDPRIRILHKKNEGQAEARNVALAHAHGEFVTFLDSDDLLHPRFAELMLKAVDSTNARMAFGQLDFYSGDYKLEEITDSPSISQVDPSTLVEKALYQTGFDNAVGGKIIGRELWNGLRFSKGRYYEDLDSFYKLALSCDKIAYLPYKLYGYRQHDNSFVHIFSEKRLDSLDVTDDMEAWMSRHAAHLLPAVRDRRMSAHFNVLLLLYREGISDTAIESRCWSVIREQRWKSLLSAKTRMKNRLGAVVSIIGGRPLLRWLARHKIGE